MECAVTAMVVSLSTLVSSLNSVLLLLASLLLLGISIGLSLPDPCFLLPAEKIYEKPRHFFQTTLYQVCLVQVVLLLETA